VRQDEAKWIQEMGRSRAYRRRRNRPDGLADATVSDDESRRPGGVIRRGEKGKDERRPGAIYRCGRGIESVR
jgi:hypothetical protein